MKRRIERHGTRLYFDPDLWEWLKKESLKKYCSISQLVRDLVAAEIRKQELNDV